MIDKEITDWLAERRQQRDRQQAQHGLAPRPRTPGSGPPVALQDYLGHITRAVEQHNLTWDAIWAVLPENGDAINFAEVGRRLNLPLSNYSARCALDFCLRFQGRIRIYGPKPGQPKVRYGRKDTPAE